MASEGRCAESLCTAGVTQVSGERLASPFGRGQAADPLLKEQGSMWVGPRLQEQEAQHAPVSTGFPPRGLVMPSAQWAQGSTSLVAEQVKQ